ncbi:ATP-dependent DNA helicase, partial [bacterium]|nr:ATP-dependent DNA helicase [bacterium]
KILLECIKENPGIQAKEIEIKLTRPIKTLERQIKVLRKLVLIERRGSRKTGGYFIINETK